MSQHLTPIAAIDVMPDSSARALDDLWPDIRPAAAARWRWLHCDRTGRGFIDWSRARLPQLARAGLLQAETRPRADLLENGIVLSLRAMNFNKDQAAEDMVSVRLWVTADLVVSTRNRRLFVIEELVRDMHAGRAPPTPAAFAVRLADRLTEAIEAAEAGHEEALDAIEEQLLDSHPDHIGAGEIEMARIARAVVKLRRHIAPQREALQRLAAAETPLLGPEDRFALREIANRTSRAVEAFDAMRDRLASLRTYVDGQHNARLSRNGFLLSVVAAIFLPLGFLTGLFGVNLAGMPGTDWPFAFALLSIGTLLLGGLLWLFFRWKKWF